ncbi:TPA: anthranilate phosphoribosyltransferase [Candidatus Marinimicrobia bacterium]|nr:MAG: Anthranilate phosphoribosyltransferase [Marinimicrobia bacterium 46_47]KUK93680.1 MAG: Anthranilate phosphoribosyltransferase [Marinimicrobia bacterium 46_43]HAE87988.1 anthranilate phosphoribosyltransferase [Candidatus Neomarinimicrobiota bacterium]HBY18544.1 anthranilate phosphoribosyltransferase [Candidatus Neomarinimicrobiota bacterium]
METLKPFLEKIAQGEDLSRRESSQALERIIRGTVTPGEIGALLMGLRMKGESVEEILGFVDTMEANMVRVDLTMEDAIDVCGTGGDKKHSFNVSTASAFVVSAGGVPVAKHGNRSVSSRCGSADVLETLGININLGPGEVLTCIRETGIGFLFAPRYHPAMKAVLPHRKNLGLRTIFNMLGPLTNPAGVRRQLVGTYNRETAKKLAEVMLMKGHTKACTVHSDDGYDEVSPFASNYIYEIDNGHIREYMYQQKTPPVNNMDAIYGTDSRYNAQKITTLLSGEKNSARDMIVLNAAFAFYVAGKVTTIPEGMGLAEAIIDSGAALAKLNALRKISQSYTV